MASSTSNFQFEDQTDEDFFDKLVDDEFDGSQSKPEEMTRVFSNLSIGDVIASSDDSVEPETDKKVESTGKDNDLKPEEAPQKGLVVLDESVPLESLGSFDSDNVDSHGLTTVKSDSSKSTSVKEVQWSAFSVGSSQEFEKASGFDAYSDFLTENSDGLVEKPLENFISNVGSTEQQDAQFYGSTNEQTVNENDPQCWENLYPGWKFDSSTGQWYQVDSYDAAADPQLDNTNVANVASVSESVGVSYLQQTSQPVLETIAEECTASSVSNWNNASQGSMDYPPNMVFDPQYPEWYYDTNTQQWHALESYTQRLANISNSTQDLLPKEMNALAGISSDQNQGSYSNFAQSEQHGIQGNGSQEFEQAWDATAGVYAGQNSVYSNLSQSAAYTTQSEGSKVFGQTWDASLSNYNQSNTNSSQSEQTTRKGWSSQEFGQNWNMPMSNSNSSVHCTAQSQGSQDFGQTWDASMSNYAQQNSLYSSSISHDELQASQGQFNRGFGGSWDTSRSSFTQQNMWQPQSVDMSAHTAGFSGNQQTGSSFSSIPGNQTTQGTGFKVFEPVASLNHGSKNSTAGFQSFTPKENTFKFSQPKVEQTLQAHLENSFYGDQSTVNAPQSSFEVANASYSNFSYTPTDGRSSDGRPPHALVAFGFGGKLIVMKNNSLLGAHLDYGSQESASNAISVLNLSEVVSVKDDSSGITNSSSHCYFQALCHTSFPGPLVGGSAAAKDVNKWIDEKIGKCESASTDFQKGEYLKLLFSLLKIMCQHYGKLRSPFVADPSQEEIDGPESAVTKLFASARNNGTRLTEFGSLAHCMHNFPSEGQIQATAIEVQNLLVSGRRKEALQYAQEGQLWGPALVLAAQLGEKFYVDTVKKMAQRQFVSGSPLRTLCLLIAGQPADVFSAEKPASSFSGAANGPHGPSQVLGNGMLDGWEENLAIITANKTKDDELVIIHLGDCLLKERGEIIAAHTCYLVAEANFESYSDSARLCLIGADHWKSPRTYASPEAIQRTEVYEYSKVLGNSQFVLLPFQPYKLIYAYMLAEVGKVPESLKYCQSSLKLLKNSNRVPEVEMWKNLLSSLEERLRTHQQGGYSSNLAPGKLVGKLFTSIDRSIHRMIGAPPVPLPPMPQSSPPNSKDNFSMSPKVSSSQSTMAMSSLMPSQSVESISEWAGDSARKSMHNRSISEPDFGRTPKQDADGQSKASGAPSRFGRIGSSLLQKTMGWVSRSRSDRQAKLGESNKFYYDEKLKRWVEEGAECPAEEASLPPPPTMPAFQNGTSEYNINSALKNPSPVSNGVPETKAPGIPPIPSENSSGIPPIPPSQNQFSARARMGVRSRYVDTFNKGNVGGGGGGALTNSFQSPAAPYVKPAIGAKFFMPVAPAPLDDQKIDSLGETIQEPTKANDPSSSVSNDASFSLPSSSSQSPSSLQRFPSMDNITPLTNKTSTPQSINGPFSRTRAASWSGTYSDANNQKMAGRMMLVIDISRIEFGT
ncbi:protein transport protein SEC16B homolog [Asparagus officinalis]|uniref:protein transport protein SEC16B homolog n=1 Tax=Asparagus officinalis TaxID=4686 RepID=UPI00098DF92C|nr:protein transport protein SEC16B homolog [Asparagus officinalis]